MDKTTKDYFDSTPKKSNVTSTDDADDYNADYEMIQNVHEVAESKKKKQTKKGRGGSENFPNVLPSDVGAGHIKKTLNKILPMWNMPPVKDDAELAVRLYDFFELCMETEQHPTWEKLCYYIGFVGSTVHRWLTGEINCSSERRNLIKKAKEFCAIYDAELAIDGKINPIIYIFRAKNFFGMVDRVEHVASADNLLGELKDKDEIAGKIMGNIIVEATEVDFTEEE